MPTLEQRVLVELLAGEITGNTTLSEADAKAADWSEVLKEAQAQTVILMAGDAAVKYRDYIEDYAEWTKTASSAHVANVRTAYSEQELNRLMVGRKFLILKGMAAASYYPKPYERSLGDIDFLIVPSERQDIKALLIENGYQSHDIEHAYHEVFNKGYTHLEMHFEIAGIPNGRPGEIVREFMSDAVNHSVTAGFDSWSFPAPEAIYHGLIILLHMQGHMLSEGLGLRHICDWACYLQKTENEPFWSELLDLFKRIGIFTYAQVISKICSMYFHINCPDWAETADEELCRDVMDDVLVGGNFGRKDETRAKSGMMISERSKTGKKHGKFYNLYLLVHNTTPQRYPIVKKHPFLCPFYDLKRIVLYIIKSAKGQRYSITRLAPLADQRKSVYDRLHLFETENDGE